MLIRHLLGQGEALWLQLGGGALSLAVFRVLCAVNFNLGMIFDQRDNTGRTRSVRPLNAAACLILRGSRLSDGRTISRR